MREGAACDWDVLLLKQRFATASHELIARRIVACRPRRVVTDRRRKVAFTPAMHKVADHRYCARNGALIEHCRATGVWRERVP